MRVQSKYFSSNSGLLLNKLIAGSSTSPNDYRTTFYLIGKELASVINTLKTPLGSTMIACSSEDADWLARGVQEGLSVKDTSLAVFWNERHSFSEDKSIEFSPIVKSYIEDINNCQTLIIIKSIIVTSCVVKTQLSRLISDINPKQILIVAPVMHKDAEQLLRNEFPTSISNKFRFITLAIDDDINEKGEVVPGIGGMVYDRLGLGNAKNKNKYIPEIVKQRREIS